MQSVVGRQKGGYGPRCSLCRPWKLGTRMRHCSLFMTWMWCFAKKVLARIALYNTFILHTNIVFWKGRSMKNIAWKPARGTFLESPRTFRTRKAIAKSQTLRMQSCFIPIFLTWTEVTFIQQVSGIYISPLLDIDEVKFSLRAHYVSGAFEKRAPGKRSSCSRCSTEITTEPIAVWVHTTK